VRYTFAIMDATILVVEDERDVRELLTENLKREGFHVLASSTGREAVEIARKERPELVVLDVMLPDLDGIEVCRELKWDAETRQIPVVMVTAKGEESDVVLGLGVGADDYVCKPFRMRELLARIRTALRRLTASAEPAPDRRRVEHGPVVVDLDRHEALIGGKSVRMRPMELRILHLLVAEPGVVHRRAEIIRECSPGEQRPDDHIVDVYVQLLRRKLGPHRDLIQTVRGVGYRLAAP